VITISIDKQGYTGHILLEPNLSFSWKTNIRFYILISTITSIVAGYFISKGGWLVLPFSGLELIIIGTSLYMFFKHYDHCEVITFTNNRVVIEHGKDKPEQSWAYQRHWSKIHINGHGLFEIPRVSIKSHGEETEMGSFLGYDEKILFIETIEKITASFIANRAIRNNRPEDS
jgi:uncharacterized membrane protein